MYERSLRFYSIYKKYVPPLLISASIIAMITSKLHVADYTLLFYTLRGSYLILVAFWLLSVIVLGIATYKKSTAWRQFVPDDFTLSKKAFITKCFLKQATFFSFGPVSCIMITALIGSFLIRNHSILDFIVSPAYFLFLILCIALNLLAFGQFGCYLMKAALYLKPWQLYGKYYDYPDDYNGPEEQKEP